MTTVHPGAPRVLVDATAIPADRAGVGRYVDELIAALDAAGEPITVVCQGDDVERYRARLSSAIVIGVDGISGRAARLIWEQVSLPRIARRSGARLIHSPHYTVPIGTSLLRTVTFHDATFMSDPDVHTAMKRRFFPAWMGISRRRADAVVVPSEATERELRAHLGERGWPRIQVAHLGVDHERFRPPTEAERLDVAARYGLGDRWIAYLGSIEPRKNVPALIEAYATLAAEWTRPADELPALALAGGEGWDVDLGPHLARVAAPGRVLRLGYLPIDDLPAYLGGADVVAYPSLGEGFGLPVLEAMACAAPVLTTRRLSIPEVGADAVSYTEPDQRSIADAILALLEHPAAADALRAAGQLRAAGFTWEACAATHLRLWDDLLNADRGDA